MLPPETLPSGVRVLHREPLHVVGMFHDLQLSLSRSEPSLEFLKVSMALIRQEAAHLPEGMGLLIVISADARPPGEAAKEHLKRMYPEVSSVVRAMARVVDGEGFAAAAKRAAISIIDMAMRLKCPSKVFGRTDEAVIWLLQQMGPSRARPYTGGDVVRAVHELRAYHEQA